jgi:hypothetical protein
MSIDHKSGLTTDDDSIDVAVKNADLLSKWLSACETVTVPGGRLAIGPPGIVVGRHGREVSFDFRGNGSQRPLFAREGCGATVLHAVGEMPAILTIGGTESKGHFAGRPWSVRDMIFERREERGQYTTAHDGIAGWQVDSGHIINCGFHNLRHGIRLQPAPRSRIISMAVRDCEFQRNACGFYVDGKPVEGPSNACGLKIDTCNSVHDLTGIHFRNWWNGGLITNCTVHASPTACVLIERSAVTMTNNYLEGGGTPKGKSTLKIRDRSHVSSRGLIARYLDIDDTSHFVAYPPSMVDQTANHTLVANYGKTDSDNDPRGLSGGYTVITGSLLIDDAGVVWRCEDGGYGKRGKWTPVGVMP